MVMDLLYMTSQGSREHAKQKTEVPKEVHGLLAVHMKTVTMNDPGVDSSIVKLHLTVCGREKSFPFQHSSTNPSATSSFISDSLKHFSVERIIRYSEPPSLQLPEEYDHHDNKVVVLLELKSSLTLGLGTTLGKAVLHLHHIIHHCPLSAKCQLRDKDSGSTIGSLFADWAFCYGNFGYGESFQLSHPHHKPQHYLHSSLFPRLTPSTNNLEHGGLVQHPHPTRQPIFIPFNKTATLCVEDSEHVLADSLRHAPELLISQMTRLRLLHKQLKLKSNRKERLKFLEDQIVTDGLSPQ